jgi:hypothetical protein
MVITRQDRQIPVCLLFQLRNPARRNYPAQYAGWEWKINGWLLRYRKLGLVGVEPWKLGGLGLIESVVKAVKLDSLTIVWLQPR